MAVSENYLAVDLGAGSGRVALGRFDGRRLRLEEVRRFPNHPVAVNERLYWDALRLLDEIKAGVAETAAEKPRSLGVDSWGVDYALLDEGGDLVGNPSCYRDRRTDGVMKRVLGKMSRDEIFAHTGLQFMEINTLYQLCSMQGSSALERAATLLMIPDLFHYWLTGVKLCEFTDATTTQLYDSRQDRWAWPVIHRLKLPDHIFPEIVRPATNLGAVQSTVAEEIGFSLDVVTPGSHDTASAVAATPAEGAVWAFLSSGTWSLFGAETAEPLLNATVLEKNFTNEGGVAGTNRLLKNICGFWLLEECRREWARQGVEASYGRLLAESAREEPCRSVVDVDDPAFVAPGDMPARIAAACERSGQPRPETTAQFARTVFDSLAVKYRLTLEDLADILARRPRVLHIVGGGAQNELVCQMVADACDTPVVAGPVEATALGNIAAQLVSAGRVSGFDEARRLIAQSVELRRYEPQPSGLWAEAAARLRSK